MSSNVKAIIVRAVATFLEVFLAAVIATGVGNLDIATASAAAIAAGGAALSVLYNALKQVVEKLDQADPLPDAASSGGTS
jgi:hypothetical protein